MLQAIHGAIAVKKTALTACLTAFDAFVQYVVAGCDYDLVCTYNTSRP